MEYLPVGEFRSLGLLQEVNRQFLHPLGLALEVVVNEDGTEEFGRVWDARGDPEGMAFGEKMRPDAVAYVRHLRDQHSKAREAVLGDGVIIQPVDYIWTEGEQ